VAGKTKQEAAAQPASIAEWRDRASGERATLERELAEMELLITQARTEAARHESKRAAVAEKVTNLTAAGTSDPNELLDLKDQLVTLTKRAVLMEAQVDALTGKQKTLTRYRDAVAAYADGLDSVAPSSDDANGASESADQAPHTMSRIILGAQEDLRREIARAMHDGPAQSLTNIVLQAQIVERLVASSPEQALSELRLLVAMVQQTLEATKSFIFDVRPMVLDDLGLVPTMRRAARERGRRAQVPVDVESMGTDRRLPVDLESALFRILDEALAGYLAAGPDRISIRLDWGEDQVEGRVVAIRQADGGTTSQGEPEALPSSADLPPALAAMVEDRRADRAAAVEAARVAAVAALPAATWREIEQRAGTIGVAVELLADGSELRVVADVAAAE
jgi:two-component system sensor histidine kinase DegS